MDMASKLYTFTFTFTVTFRCSLGYYKGRVSVECVCYSLLLSSVCYTVVLRYSSMIM